MALELASRLVAQTWMLWLLGLLTVLFAVNALLAQSATRWVLCGALVFIEAAILVYLVLQRRGARRVLEVRQADPTT